MADREIGADGARVIPEWAHIEPRSKYVHVSQTLQAIVRY